MSDRAEKNPGRLDKRPLITRPSRPERLPHSVVAPDAAEKRKSMIAEAAYYIALRRNFEPGHDVQDWLLAESQVDAALAGGNIPAPRP